MVSTRRRQHSNSRSPDQKYAVGDRVEVIRVKGLAVGYLLSKAKQQDDNSNSPINKRKVTRSNGSKNAKKTKSPSPTKTVNDENAAAPHWIVSVEGGSGDEEVIAETLLGKVLEEVGGTESSDDSSQSATFEKAKVVNKKAKTSKPTVAKGKVTFKKPASNKKGKSSIKTAPPPPKASSKKKKSAASNNNNNSEPEVVLADWERKRPAPRPKKMDGLDMVEEVSYGTGTLFFYRGAKHRRVEYVARI